MAGPTSAANPDTHEPHGVRVAGLTKTYVDATGARVHALDRVDLAVPAGEFWVLLGPSGCGKTTLLRCLAGLEEPDGGTIAFRDRGTPAAKGRSRPVGMVFQNYALWPHMTVEQNVDYPLGSVKRRTRAEKARDRAIVSRLLGVMGLEGYAKRRMTQLSGGQQQRVALARALAVSGDLVLFDEPLSNIDAKVRETLRLELATMQRELGFTAVYVTHDQSEAMELADKIAVMRSGEIVQIGTPREIYNQPADEYVARFVGASNILSVTSLVARRDAWAVAVDGLGELQVRPPRAGRAPAGSGDAGEWVLWSRAHSWSVNDRAGGAGTTASWPGEVVASSFMGSDVEHVVSLGDHKVRIWDSPDTRMHNPGETVRVSVDLDSMGLVKKA